MLFLEPIDRRHIQALEDLLAEGNCVPGKLIGPESGHMAWIMNAMLYDKFHGHGWKLDLLTGRFVQTGE